MVEQSQCGWVYTRVEILDDINRLSHKGVYSKVLAKVVELIVFLTHYLYHWYKFLSCFRLIKLIKICSLMNFPEAFEFLGTV